MAVCYQRVTQRVRSERTNTSVSCFLRILSVLACSSCKVLVVAGACVVLETCSGWLRRRLDNCCSTPATSNKLVHELSDTESGASRAIEAQLNTA